MSELEQLPVHAKAWNQRELLAKIISRQVHVIDDIGGFWPSYQVQERDGDDIHQQLDEINSHLEKLDWVVRLYPEEPWVMQVLPAPTRQFPKNHVAIVFWLLSLFTTAFAAEKWMASGRPQGGWIFEHATLDALVGYSLPILFTIMVASFVQKHVANRYGVRVPHLFPMFGPAVLWWPFGIIGFTSMPRSDARVWPDRASMGNTAVSAPLVIILLGMAIALLGLQLTPNYVALSSAPLMLELPLFLNLLGLYTEGDVEMMLKTAWAHPLTRAGSTLMFMGWISLLPIPTFPGGRVIISRMGIAEARTGSTQIMLLMVMMLFAFLFGAFSGWSIWTPVVAVLFVLLIQRGSDPRLPVVLDDFKGMPEQDHRRIGWMLFVAFMFALPAQIPFEVADDWDQSLEFSLKSDDIVLGNVTVQYIYVNNPSLVTQTWNLEIFQPPGGSIDSHLDCSNDHQCSGEILPQNEITIRIDHDIMPFTSITNPQKTVGIKINDVILNYTISPDEEVFPIGDWVWQGSISEPAYCVQLHWNEPIQTSISLESQGDLQDLITLDGTPNDILQLDGTESEICLSGKSGLGPDDVNQIGFNLNQTVYQMDIGKSNIIPKLIMPETGINIIPQSNQSGWNEWSTGGELFLELEGDCPTEQTTSVPLRPIEGDWIWDLAVKRSGRIPIVEQQILTILAPEHSVITWCSAGDLMTRTDYLVSFGPSLSLLVAEDWKRAWEGQITFENSSIFIHNPGLNNLSLTIDQHGNGADWNVSNEIVLLAGQTTEIIAVEPLSGQSFAWLVHDDWQVILHLANHEV